MKIVANCSQNDCVICNTFELPTSGCAAGAGVHITIPADFATRIASGQDVPGCTYSRLEPDGSLWVTANVEAQLNIPAQVLTLQAGAIRGEAASLLAKLNALSAVAIG